VEFIDLKTQQKRIRKQLDRNINKVLEHGRYILGPEVGELEEQLAGYVGVRHCIGVSSGTDALLMALMALEVGPGHEVITTPFSFIATGEMIALLGAKPVFVDIDPRTFNIDAQKIEQAITGDTRAIIPVSLYGQCADYDSINEIAARHDIPVIEDGAQSFGAGYNGRKSCGLTTVGCASFFPSKPLGAYGDAGACFTDDDELARVLREIRIHGQDRRYHHSRIGLNARMDTIQAAILLAKMEIFPEEVEARQQVGARYNALIEQYCSGAGEEGVDTSQSIIPPFIESGNTSVYAQYTVLANSREELQQAFRKEDIPTAVHYPVPLNQQPCLETDEFDMPVSRELSGKVISLPMHPYLAGDDQLRIVKVLCGAQ